MRWNSLISDLSYGVSDRFALQVGVPFIFSKYTGNFAHVPAGRPSLDNGAWNGTFQDFHVEARYMAVKGPLVVTPFVAAVLPSHSYEYFAHSAVGRDLREYSAGVNLGRRLDPVLPDGYAHLRYSFAVPERVLGVWHNYSNADLELGYFVGPSLAVKAVGAWQVSHGGYRIPEDIPRGSINFLHHDQLAREDHLNLGIGVSFAATGSLDVYAVGLKTISGKNGILARSIRLGASWSFSPRQLIRSRKRPAPALLPRA
jgi:hypothetical protein